MLLVLKRSDEQESALRKLLDDQQDKASPNYHKWLTPEQFGRQFGPADQDIQTVSSWLQMHSFQIGQVTKGRTVIEFSGTAA
jgi:subtilase family serine protease